MADIINPAINPSIGTEEGRTIMQTFLTNFISLALGVAGAVTFFMLLIGAVQWIMSGGDKEGAEKARKKITSALIGLAIVFLIFAIIRLVEDIFGIPITQFDIPVIE